MTTAVITENDADAPKGTFAEQVDAAYAERDEWNAIEADLAAFASTLEIMGIDPVELLLGTTVSAPRTLRPHRRANPCARSMTRKGRKYAVRKDHGTKTRRQEIDADNDARSNRMKGSNAQRRRASKLQNRSGDPRVIRKLVQLGDLLI